jgi:PAS domain S-box-containing protein
LLPALHIYTIPNIGNIVVLVLALGIVYALAKYKFLAITPATAAENIISTMADSLILLDKSGNILDVNKSTLDLLGYRKNELEGKSADIISAEGNIKELLLDSASRREPIRNHEINFKVKSGENVPVIFSASVVTDDAGSTAGIVCIARDITERKKAEESLRESEKRLEAIWDSLPIGIVVIDAETHKITYANASTINMIGAPGEQVVGHVCHRYICPAEKGKCPITDLGQSVDKSERVLIKANGETIPILKTVVPLILDGRKSLIEAFIDITERKRAENALRESENKHRTLLENLPQKIFLQR